MVAADVDVRRRSPRTAVALLLATTDLCDDRKAARVTRTTVKPRPGDAQDLSGDAVDEEGAPAPVKPVRPEPRPAEATSSAPDRAGEAVGPEDEVRQPAHISSWLLRVGLAFVFVYAATTTSIDPVAAATYFPSVLPREWVMEVVLPAFVVYEVLLAVGLLTGRYTYAASLLATATMVGIIVVNANAFDVLFRNVAIAFAALSLAVQTREARRAGAPDQL